MASDRGVIGMSNVLTLAALLSVGGMLAVEWDVPLPNLSGASGPPRAGDATPPAAGETAPAAQGGGPLVAASPPASESAGTTAPPATGGAVVEVQSGGEELGLLCGDRRLRGSVVGAISEPVSEEDPRLCGTAEAVIVHSAAGVTVTPPATMTCAAARGLAEWLDFGVGAAAETHVGEPVREIIQISGYSCRSVNRQPDARLSEHAYANALDVAAFVFETEETIAVGADWAVGDDAGPRALFLQEAWRSACGPFGTVLGPLSDAFHADHFHVDAKARRSPYCR